MTNSDASPSPSPVVVLSSVTSFLQRGRRREAYTALQQAVVQYPDDPMLLSYFGYLSADIDGKYRNGIDLCQSAIRLFNRRALTGQYEVDEAQLCPLYLNLGKAYLAAGKKKEAIETFNAGLKFDKQNRELHSQIEQMGIRKLVPLPFLARTNPINEMIGRLLRKKRDTRKDS